MAREGSFMTIKKYPVAGEIYDSCLYPGEQCEVISVIEAQVTIQWIGQYARVKPQTVSVNRFIQDFALAKG